MEEDAQALAVLDAHVLHKQPLAPNASPAVRELAHSMRLLAGAWSKSTLSERRSYGMQRFRDLLRSGKHLPKVARLLQLEPSVETIDVETGKVSRSKKRKRLAAPPRAEPSELVCPITMMLMVDPVVCCDGHTYERTAISKWLATHNTSPLTNEVLDTMTLLPNRALKTVIERWNASTE